MKFGILQVLVDAVKNGGPREDRGSEVGQENNFATYFLLEIPLRGFPFQRKIVENYRLPKHITNLNFRRISFEKEIPSRGSRAGSIFRKHCVLDGGVRKGSAGKGPRRQEHISYII